METNSELQKQLEIYLNDLNSTQLQMTEFLGQQQLSLVSPNAIAIEESNSRGAELLDTFQQLVERRTELLARARESGFEVGSLEELASILGQKKSQALSFQRLRTQGNLLVQSSFSQWVACQKATLHCRELVQIIAHGGRQSLKNRTGKGRAPGGAILDASV